jgi:DNA-directed RNA polymerase subunit beta
MNWTKALTFHKPLRIDETARRVCSTGGHLPHDAPRRAAHRRRGASLVPTLVLHAQSTYDLSRMWAAWKLNARVGREESTGPMVLNNEDILAVVKILVDLRNGRGEVDDIDHLGNRRASRRRIG